MESNFTEQVEILKNTIVQQEKSLVMLSEKPTLVSASTQTTLVKTKNKSNFIR